MMCNSFCWGLNLRGSYLRIKSSIGYGCICLMFLSPKTYLFEQDVAEKNFVQLSYTDAIELLLKTKKKFEFPVLIFLTIWKLPYLILLALLLYCGHRWWKIYIFEVIASYSYQNVFKFWFRSRFLATGYLPWGKIQNSILHTKSSLPMDSNAPWFNNCIFMFSESHDKFWNLSSLKS